MTNTVVINKSIAKKIKEGYPWIFLDNVTTPSIIATSEPGQLVKVIDPKGRYLGTGYVDPTSKICIRMLGHLVINKLNYEFFYKQIQQSLQKRHKTMQNRFYRLVNSEGDHLPGLIIDRFDNVLSCQITTSGMLAYETVIVHVLKDLLAPISIVLRIPTCETPKIIGQKLGDTIVEEYGVKFYADLIQGQKTGWYFDQRENRHLITEYCLDKDVLDVFCYNGGFGIAAASNNARSVTFIDSSKFALELTQKSLELNIHHAKIDLLNGDAFEELVKLKEQSFDIVVVDPPPFIPAKVHKASGLKGYFKLALASISKVRPHGLLFFASCSHHINGKELQFLILKAVNESRRISKVLKVLGHTFDHPIHPKLPESKYLNAILLKIS